VRCWACSGVRARVMCGGWFCGIRSSTGLVIFQVLRGIQAALSKRKSLPESRERREAMHEYAGYRLSSGMVEEFHSTDRVAYSSVCEERRCTSSVTSSAAGFPVQGVPPELVPFVCDWDHDCGRMILPRPVLERLIAWSDPLLLMEEPLQFGDSGRLFGILTLAEHVTPQGRWSWPVFVFFECGFAYTGLVQTGCMSASPGISHEWAFSSLRVDLAARVIGSITPGLTNQESPSRLIRGDPARSGSRWVVWQLVLGGLCGRRRQRDQADAQGFAGRGLGVALIRSALRMMVFRARGDRF